MNEGGAAIPAEESKSVILDRPFAYMIVDIQCNVPLFFGVGTSRGGDAKRDASFLTLRQLASD